MIVSGSNCPNPGRRKAKTVGSWDAKVAWLVPESGSRDEKGRSDDNDDDVQSVLV